jgi:autophagy-related protein 2
MAFFSGLSSSIGKRLLLYGLRHIDLLDKDPADFVSVDVGKRTTLEVRDVGLHVKVCGEGLAIQENMHADASCPRNW